MDILAQPPAPSQEEIRNKAIFRSRIPKGKANKSVLERKITEERMAWLARYAKNRYEAYYNALSTWRNDLDCYMKQSEDYFDWRRTEANRNSGQHSIFSRQNDSLNLVGAFSEFFVAHAQNDLFGSSPWFSTKPQGKADIVLADHLAAHAAWKLRPTGLTECYREGVSLAAVLGTCFTKKTWETHTDYSESNDEVLHESDGEQVTTAAGDNVSSTDPIVEGEDGSLAPAKDPSTELDPESQEYKEVTTENVKVIYANVKGYNLQYRDVAFDRTAPELDLRYTDFFHVFEKLLLDCIADFGLDELGAYRLYAAAQDKRTEATKGESYRGETAPSVVGEGEQLPGTMPNVPIKLCEGYLRLDVNGKGKLSQVYVVFCPELEIILKVDYLANITPGGALPIHAHTIYKPAWRITGRGFFEKYATTQRMVDDLFNQVNYLNRKSCNPITAIDRSKMEAEDEDAEAQPFDPDKPVNLKPDEKLDDAIQFKALPDLTEGMSTQQQIIIQMTQLRTGITAASQGEMSSLPETNTATGINQLLSRAAVLLKAPIDGLKSSYTSDINYTIKLLYANQDRDETFLYGEGENMELANLKASDVKDLDIHVELLLTQSQKQDKLKSAQIMTATFAQWLQVPEPDKDAARPLYIQIARSLDFANADTFFRKGVVGIADALKLLPPDQAQQVMAALQNAQGTPGPEAKLSMSYKDAPDDIRRQMEKRDGFVPSTMPRETKEKAATPANPPAAQPPASPAPQPANVSPMPAQGPPTAVPAPQATVAA